MLLHREVNRLRMLSNDNQATVQITSPDLARRFFCLQTILVDVSLSSFPNTVITFSEALLIE